MASKDRKTSVSTNPSLQADSQQSVDWRWRRATSLVNTGKRARRTDDATVRRVARYLNRRQRALAEDEMDRLDVLHPDICLAETIHDEGGSIKWMLEARLLARQDRATIAKYIGTSTEVVTMYEAVFFAVSDRLDSPALVMALTMP
jgi:hypothetical protein